MGTWGYNPFQSDSALDTVFDLERSLRKILSKGTPNKNGEEWRAVVEILTGIQDTTKTPLFIPETWDLAEKRTIQLRADKDWTDSWDNPRGIKRALDKQLVQVRSHRRRWGT